MYFYLLCFATNIINSRVLCTIKSSNYSFNSEYTGYKLTSFIYNALTILLARGFREFNVPVQQLESGL
jgi:hypothetical protein